MTKFNAVPLYPRDTLYLYLYYFNALYAPTLPPFRRVPFNVLAYRLCTCTETSSRRRVKMIGAIRLDIDCSSDDSCNCISTGSPETAGYPLTVRRYILTKRARSSHDP